eukprot:11537203-Heterocapsa_arctica.AAC.1
MLADARVIATKVDIVAPSGMAGSRMDVVLGDELEAPQRGAWPFDRPPLPRRLRKPGDRFAERAMTSP